MRAPFGAPDKCSIPGSYDRVIGQVAHYIQSGQADMTLLYCRTSPNLKKFSGWYLPAQNLKFLPVFLAFTSSKFSAHCFRLFSQCLVLKSSGATLTTFERSAYHMDEGS